MICFVLRMGQMMEDQFVMVYDMRMMKMSLPLRALTPPYYLRIMPGLSSCVAAVSLLGQWVVMDAAQPENSFVSMNYQVIIMLSTLCRSCYYDFACCVLCLLFLLL